MPNQEALVRIVLLVALIVGGISVTRAHDGPEGCLAPSAYLKLQTLASYSRTYSDGSVDAYVCLTTAVEEEVLATTKFPNILTNQVWSEIWCGDMRMTVWIVNCNEA